MGAPLADSVAQHDHTVWEVIAAKRDIRSLRFLGKENLPEASNARDARRRSVVAGEKDCSGRSVCLRDHPKGLAFVDAITTH